MSHLIGRGRYAREAYPSPPPPAASGGSPVIALLASFIGGEANTTSTAVFQDMVILNTSPFAAAIGANFYVAGFIGAGDTAGLVDLYDNAAARSLLAAPVSITNVRPSAVYSAALIHPLVPGHSISVRAKAVGDSPTTSVQSVYVI